MSQEQIIAVYSKHTEVMGHFENGLLLLCDHDRPFGKFMLVTADGRYLRARLPVGFQVSEVGQLSSKYGAFRSGMPPQPNVAQQLNSDVPNILRGVLDYLAELEIRVEHLEQAGAPDGLEEN